MGIMVCGALHIGQLFLGKSDHTKIESAAVCYPLHVSYCKR
jgi:hypothetical protein